MKTLLLASIAAAWLGATGCDDDAGAPPADAGFTSRDAGPARLERPSALPRPPLDRLPDELRPPLP